MTRTSLEAIDKDIKNLEERLEKLKKEREAAVTMPAEKRLATELHTTLCSWNHTDGCSWEYELDWNGHAHSVYLNKATVLLNMPFFRVMDSSRKVDIIMEIITVIKGL